jgi:hypothetical protein
MSFRVLGESDTGDTTHYGGADMAKISKLFNGVNNVATVDINSTTKFRSGALRIANPANTFTYNVTGETTLTSNVTLTLPNVTGGVHTLVSRNSADILIKKEINAWDNDLGGTAKIPSVRKYGAIQCGGVTGGGAGMGLLYGFQDLPVTGALPIRGQDLFGSYWRYSTTTTANTPTGIKLPARFIWKDYLPYFRVKTRVPASTTNTRQYVGLSWFTTLPGSDTPLENTHSGVLVGWRSTDANIQVFRNGGTAASPMSPSVTNTGVPKTTAVRHYEISFVNVSDAIQVKVRILNETASAALYTSTPNFTTNLPATGVDGAMSPSIVFSSTTSTDTNYDVYYAELEQKES